MRIALERALSFTGPRIFRPDPGVAGSPWKVIELPFMEP